MRCPSCNKFCAFEPQDPEMEIQIEDGIISGTVEIKLNSECCGDEMKGYSFDIDHHLTEEIESEFREAGYAEIDLAATDVAMEIKDEDCENTDRYEGTGRGAKHFYGFSATGSVVATIGETTVTVEFTLADEVQSSEMDELC